MTIIITHFTTLPHTLYSHTEWTPRYYIQNPLYIRVSEWYNRCMSKKIKTISTYHSNGVTGGEKQKVMRGRNKKLKLSDMETYKTNKWDTAVDKWLEKHE